MHYKRIKKLALLILTALTVFITPSNKISAVSSNFYDTDEHWAEDYIDTLYQLDIFKGDNGYANVDAQITRGEFTALTARTFFKINRRKSIPMLLQIIFFSKKYRQRTKAGLLTEKAKSILILIRP